MKTILSVILIFAYSHLAEAQLSNTEKRKPSVFTCGNILFSVPENWKVEASGQNYSIRLPALYYDPQRWINLAIIEGTLSSGNIEKDFTTTWQKILGGYTKYQEPFLIREKSIKGYDVLRGGTNVRKGNESPVYAHLWVAKVKDRLETILVFANNSNDFDITVNTIIRPFWASLKYNNLPQTQAADYSLKGNGIQGIYIGLKSGLTLNTGIAKNISFLLIYNDGYLKVANKFPDNGFNEFDREVDREMNPDYWGSYNVKEGSVIFNRNGQNRTLGFSYKSPRVVYNEYSYTKLSSVDNLTLSGTYTADKSESAIDAFGHEPTITFSKLGRFEDNTALYYVKSYDSIFKKPGSGKYSINNYSILLVYDDERGSASFSFITLESGANRSIQIGEHILIKK